MSVFIITKNEIDYIDACIESVADCAEIIVVDSGSTDGTLERLATLAATGLPIRVIERPWPGYAAQKQFALEQCSQDWCLNIDADERLDTALRTALPALIAAPASVVGWRIARRPYLIGYGYTPPHVHERRNLRLIRRGAGAYDLTQKVHEGITPQGDVRDAASGSLLHYRPLGLDQQILKENTYSTLKSEQIGERGQSRSRGLILFNPLMYFIRLYFRNGLWRCGMPGLIQAITSSVYSFLTEGKVQQRAMLAERPVRDDWQQH